ncbi:hypothetical protein GCM10009558_082060 [Virgisporangium aurantiacum]
MWRSGYWADQEWTHETALRAARRTGDRVGAAHAHSGLGFGLVLSGRFPAAGPHLDRAAALFEELGDVDNLIDVRVRQTLLYDRQDRLDDALRAAGSAYDLAASVYDLVPPTGPAGSGSAAGVRSRLLNVLGWCHVRLGDHRTAIRYTEEAVAIAVGLRAAAAELSRAGLARAAGSVSAFAAAPPASAEAVVAWVDAYLRLAVTSDLR